MDITNLRSNLRIYVAQSHKMRDYYSAMSSEVIVRPLMYKLTVVIVVVIKIFNYIFCVSDNRRAHHNWGAFDNQDMGSAYTDKYII